MKVVLKEKEFNYTSDFPDNWSKSSSDLYKCPVAIGKYQTFIKRFEKRKPGDIPGWELLLKLKGKFAPNLPQVFDVVQTEEYRKAIYYIFYEYLNGRTVDDIIINDASIDLKKLVNDLYSALHTLHDYGYWFTAFEEKNILFDEQRRRFLLIDLDSALPLNEARGKDSWKDKEYIVLVYRFFEEIAGESALENLPGIALNYLEVVFLVLNIKMTLTAKKYEYKSNELNSILPALLDKADPAFRQIFVKALSANADTKDVTWTDEIKEMICSKIIDGNVEDLEVITRPVIKSFKASNHAVGNRESFILSWELENTESVEVHRNGVLYKKMNSGENSIKITESYDGKARKIDYTLLAINNIGGTRSQPLSITISDRTNTNNTAATATTQLQPYDTDIRDVSPLRKDKTGKLRTIKFTLLALLLSIVVTSSLIIYYFVHKETKFSILKSEATEGDSVIIFGNNIPKDSSTLKVYFNNIKANIAEYKPGNIKVIVPMMGAQPGLTKVAVVIKGDTSFASGNLSIKQNSKPAEKPVSPEIVSQPKDPSLPFPKVIIPLRNKPKKKENKVTTVTSTPAAAKTEKQPEIVKEKPQKVVNIYQYVSVSSNEFKKKTFGGVKNVKITVKNDSKYDLDSVKVEISYQKNNEKEVKKETLLYNNVRSHSSATIEAPSTNRGKKVQLKIISIRSNQLNKDVE